jgi:hypothetical protein
VLPGQSIHLAGAGADPSLHARPAQYGRPDYATPKRSAQSVHHPTNLDESNVQEAINRWEKQDFHTVFSSIGFVKSSLPIVSKKLLSIDKLRYKADITALDENVSGLMVEIENFKRVLDKLYGVSTNNTGGVGLPGQVRRLIQA